MINSTDGSSKTYNLSPKNRMNDNFQSVAMPRLIGFTREDVNFFTGQQSSIKNIDDSIEVQDAFAPTYAPPIPSAPRKYVTDDGKLSIIITNKDKKVLNGIKESVKSSFTSDDAQLKTNLDLIDGFKMEVSPLTMGKILKFIPSDSVIYPDNDLQYPDPARKKYNLQSENWDSGNFLNTIKPHLNVDKLWEQGYTGKGVTIAFLDSGLYNHNDFKGRIKTFVSMSNPQKVSPLLDPYGHGTLTTGIAAGSGASSSGKIKGIAPEADIVGVQITSVSEAIKGLQWVIEHKDEFGIKVVNMSLGDKASCSFKDDLWAQAAEKLWDAGVVVVVAAGNEGREGPGSISTPGIDPKIITVGSFDSKNTTEKEDDEVDPNSSTGPTYPDQLQKPDVIGPGVNIFGPVPPKSTINTPDKPHIGDDYMADSGTSFSTPITTGVIALLLQANPDLKPDEVKKIITDTADKYIPNAQPGYQGHGVIDPEEALQVALSKKNGNSASGKGESPEKSGIA